MNDRRPSESDAHGRKTWRPRIAVALVCIAALSNLRLLRGTADGQSPWDPFRYDGLYAAARSHLLSGEEVGYVADPGADAKAAFIDSQMTAYAIAPARLSPDPARPLVIAAAAESRWTPPAGVAALKSLPDGTVLYGRSEAP